jgi:hypothetical protein
MVVEQIVNLQSIKKHKEYPLYIGVIYTLLSFATSYFLFNKTPRVIGISTVLFVVILAIPLVSRLFAYEEKKDISKNMTKGSMKRGLVGKNFFSKHRKHKVVIDFFLYFFIGVFITFFVLSLASPHLVFSKEQLHGVAPAVQQVAQSQYAGYPPPPSPPMKTLVLSIFKNNAGVMALSFLLSLFYGSGALFLITLNASVFASALATVVRLHAPIGLGFFGTYVFTACNVGTMFFHMLPEVGGYLLAAIAGGILAIAIRKETLFKKQFNAVLRDTLWLFVGAITLLFVSAVIEVGVSRRLFESYACTNNPFGILGIAGFIVLGLVVVEYFRTRRMR